MKLRTVIVIILSVFFLILLILPEYQRYQEEAHNEMLILEAKNMLEKHHELVMNVQQIMKREEYDHLMNICRHYDMSKQEYDEQIVVSDPRYGSDLKLSDVFTSVEQSLIMELFSLKSNGAQIYYFESYEMVIADETGIGDVRVINLGHNEEEIEIWKHRSAIFEEVYDGWYAMYINTRRF